MTNTQPTQDEKKNNFIRNAIDLIVKDTGYPVLSTMLTGTDIAKRADIRHLEHKGLIKGIDVEVPSSILPGKTTSYRAYYTEREVPAYVAEMGQAE